MSSVVTQCSASLSVTSFLFQCYRHPPHLHSFPTRRSSDLPPARRRPPRRRPHQRPRAEDVADGADRRRPADLDRKSTRLNSSHLVISYAVFCLKKKKKDGGDDEVRQQRLLRPIHQLASHHV